MLGRELDTTVRKRLEAIRESGGVVNRHIVQCVAKGVLKAVDPMSLSENGGHVDIGDPWARSILHRMGYTKRAATTGKLQLPAE